jgi:Flp pilus assembly protein TadD
MTRSTLTRLAAVIPAALLTFVAAPAHAQNGSLQGRVVNESGQPQRQVPVTLDQQGVEKPQQKKTVTDNQGDFVITGLPGGSTWVATVVWGKVSGRSPAVTIKPRETVRMPQVVVMEGGLEKAKASGAAATNVTKDEAAARAARMSEIEGKFKEADAAAKAGNFDAAIATLTELTKEIEKCAVCHARLGDVHARKKDHPAAEKAYLEAIALDANLPDPYAALATLYNEMQRFDDAAKMAAKANELLAAKGGGGDAASLYNQGVILWNQGKAAEAQPWFEKAVAADPKMADAHYQLGMTFVNQGKLSEAKQPFETYLKLAPNGANASQVKELLKIIK